MRSKISLRLVWQWRQIKGREAAAIGVFTFGSKAGSRTLTTSRWEGRGGQPDVHRAGTYVEIELHQV